MHTSHLQDLRTARQLPRSSAVPGGLLLMLLSLLLVFAAAPAWAQVSSPDLTSILSATPDNDWSMRMWVSIFGDFAKNPLSTLGGPTSLLGGVFLIFNVCIFGLGSTWALYGILSAVAATANDGEVLGKRMSTVWFPIRMIIGIAGMVPIFGGFTLNQAVMMLLTTVGIGLGNSMWAGAVQNTSQFQALMSNQPFQPTAIADVRNATQSMFLSNLCVLAQAENEAARLIDVSEQTRPVVVNNSGSTRWQISYGSKNNVHKCGFAAVTATVRSASSATSFRVASVKYDGIAKAATDAYSSGLETLNSQVAGFATDWYGQYKAAKNVDGGVSPPFPSAAIDAAVNQFLGNAAVALRYSLDQSALTDTAKSNMLSVGWFGAGAWYSTFAEVNAAVADASKAPAVQSKPPGVGNLNALTYTANTREVLQAAAEKLQESSNLKSQSGEGDSQALLDSVIKDSCLAFGVGSNLVGTATGNCSLGQGLVSAALRATAIGSGGGGNGEGSISFDSMGWVNPIIMMKNVGDYVMTFSSTLLLAGPITEMAGKVLGWFGAGASVVGAATGAAPVAALGAAAGAVGTLLAVAKTIAMFTIVIGAAMAIYIPLIPFITWIGAIVAYAASMIEGLAGATLHAMAHLEGDGEGLGQRTSQGYMYYLNAVLRPGLMIIGFFAASAIMLAIGTLQAQMFLPAMAGVQGNSVTGLASIAMFLVVFFVMNMTLISASFNLIYVITDQVLGFLGGAIDSKLGRDTEDKANNMFLLAARVGPTAVAQVGKAREKAGKGNKGGSDDGED